ncbi:MAG: hypothetical protein PHU06_11185, partial [Gallionella sp.]|nr:hypothetical protein [Gallionella sp.]MDD4959853.1 hypothetical protein [Gallionella sp.]
LLSHGLDVPEGYRTAVPNQIRLTNKKLTLSSKLSIQGAGGEGKPSANQQNRPLPNPLPQAGEGIRALGNKRVNANPLFSQRGCA